VIDRIDAPVDGLHTAVFLRGDGPTRRPAMVLRTPYGVEDRVADATRMAADGVAVVIQDVRGRFGSAEAGPFDLGLSDRLDGAACVAWAREQPWCDGRVGLWGFSYGGFTQWQALLGCAEAGVPVACAAPSMAPPPWQGVDFRRGGAVELSAAAHWLPRQAFRFDRAFETDHVLDAATGWVDIDLALAHPALQNPRTRSTVARVVGNGVFAGLWERVFGGSGSASGDSAGPSVDGPVEAPLLIAGSWYDVWSEGTTEAFAWAQQNSASPSVAASHRLVMAPQGHGFDPPREVDLGPEALRFGLDVDHRWALEWLFDRDRPLRDLAPVTYFSIGPNEWRSASSWPPPGTHVVTLDLPDVDRTLHYDPARPVPTRGGAGLGLSPGPSDQHGLSGADRDDVLTFEWPVLERALDLAGPVITVVEVTAGSRHLDLTAKLVDVDPAGRAMSICDGISRVELDGPRARVEVRLGVVGYVVAVGHHLRLDVSCSNFPRFDLNPRCGPTEATVHGGRLNVVAFP
jgi:putative CocE/NonD family hydrolase